jgi:hypothetical protein
MRRFRNDGSLIIISRDSTEPQKHLTSEICPEYNPNTFRLTYLSKWPPRRKDVCAYECMIARLHVHEQQTILLMFILS